MPTSSTVYTKQSPYKQVHLLRRLAWTNELPCFTLHRQYSSTFTWPTLVIFGVLLRVNRPSPPPLMSLLVAPVYLSLLQSSALHSPSLYLTIISLFHCFLVLPCSACRSKKNEPCLATRTDCLSTLHHALWNGLLPSYCLTPSSNQISHRNLITPSYPPQPAAKMLVIVTVSSTIKGQV